MENQFLIGYEFDNDGVVKVTFQDMKQAVLARYRWSDDRTWDVEYPQTAEIQQAHEAAVKAYKDGIQDRIKKHELDGRAGPSLMAAVADKLPAKQTFRVGLSEPRFLILTPENGAFVEFDKAD